MLPVWTAWFVTRNVSTSETDCADAGRSARHMQTSARTPTRRRLLILVLVDGDASRSHDAGGAGSVNGHADSSLDAFAAPIVERRGAVGSDRLEAHDEREVRAEAGDDA